MKITHVETLHCDAGWRNFSFLKIATADGIVGWSEFSEGFGTAGLGGVIAALAKTIIGADPRRIGLITSALYTKVTPARAGLNHLAIAAIENALLDIKAKALGVPIYDLFGGAIRTRIPLYWSHCGTYRARNADLVGAPPLKTYDDISRLGEEVKRRGFHALKTNILLPGKDGFTSFNPGFGRSPGFPELNWTPPSSKPCAASSNASATRSVLRRAFTSTSISTSRRKASAASPTKWPPSRSPGSSSTPTIPTRSPSSAVRPLPHRLLRSSHLAARVQALFRDLRDGRRDRRRAMERARRIGEDRRDGRSL